MSNLDIKLLRDELAKVIGDNKRFTQVVGEQGKKIIGLTLKVDQSTLERDQMVLERDQLSTKLEQANAKIGVLVNMLKNKEQDKADIDKVLKFYDNSHTPPSHKTITQREINKEKKEERRTRKTLSEGAEAARVDSRVTQSAAGPSRRSGTGRKSAHRAEAAT